MVDYSRQEAMDADMENMNRRDNVIIIGCGGVGSWVAMMLAMYGHTCITLIDGDKIAPSNLNRLPFPQTWVGRNKAIALRKVIKFLRPECHVLVSPFHVTHESLEHVTTLAGSMSLGYTGMVYDCTDDARIQKVITTYCKEGNLAYRKIGYEGYRIGTYSQMDDVWIDEEQYQPGYRTTRANVLSSAMAASVGVLGHMLNAPDVTLNMRSILEEGI
jgi:molybdopterin/thiamine biosynthesis adenylyltransferase